MIKIGDLYKTKYYVYEHLIDGNVFYIGKGTRTRAVEFGGRSSLWNAIVKERFDEISVNILANFESNSEAEDYEKRYIKRMSETGVMMANLQYNSKSNENLKVLGLSQSKSVLTINENKDIKIPKCYLDKPLEPYEKRKLCEILNLKDTSGRIAQWTSIHQILKKKGYEVENKQVRYGKKRVRISIIKEPMCAE